MKPEHETLTDNPMNPEYAFQVIRSVEEEVGKVIVGQQVLIQRLLTGLFAGIPYSYTKTDGRTGCGHILLEGVPGVAKTLLATTLAHVISARFQRIQLTPDMLPADIIGTRIYEAETATFRVEKGPLFANIVLADEINRATPKTQSALLEAMQERQITLADMTYRLDDPFWVLATQNPIEQEGVYALPEAQLDRFSMMLRVDYPDHDAEVVMLSKDFEHVRLESRLHPADVARIRQVICEAVYVDRKIFEYIVRIGRATRSPGDVGLDSLKDMLMVGISPRAYQHILALARVTAFLHGRQYVLPQDVKEIIADAARHRIVRSIRAEAEKIDADEILRQILSAVPIP